MTAIIIYIYIVLLRYTIVVRIIGAKKCLALEKYQQPTLLESFLCFPFHWTMSLGSFFFFYRGELLSVLCGSKRTEELIHSWAQGYASPQREESTFMFGWQCKPIAPMYYNWLWKSFFISLLTTKLNRLILSFMLLMFVEQMYLIDSKQSGNAEKY